MFSLSMVYYHLLSQGINEPANFRFLQRLSVISCFLPRLPSTKNGLLQRLSVISGFLLRLPSTKNGFLQRLSVISCFLPRLPSTKKWLPAETVRVILFPVETLCRKLNHTDSLRRKLFTKYNSLGRKQEITDSLDGSQI